jgi:hypothetical protein
MRASLTFILFILIIAHSYGQENRDVRMGLSFDYRVGKNIISQLSFNYKEIVQLDIGGGYATYHKNYLKGFDQNIIEGFYYGLGVSGDFQGDAEESSKIRSYMTTGFKYYRGKAQIKATEIIKGNVYDDYVYTVNVKDRKFNYFEYYLGVKLRFGKHIAVSLLPIMIESSTIAQDPLYKANFAPIGRYTGVQFSAGCGLQLLW